MNIPLNVPRGEYPRPDFVRKHWLSLNGEWNFAFDDNEIGIAEDWVNDPGALGRKIIVPFPFQSALSGIGDNSPHPVIWYQRTFKVPAQWGGKRILLNFGAVDFGCTVWVNGQYAGSNIGGYVPFTFDITDLVGNGENHLTLRVVDDERLDQPRGKQSARRESWDCWYTRVSGIWQSVWLEPVSSVHLKKLKLVPDIDRQELTVNYELSAYTDDVRLHFTASIGGDVVAEIEVPFKRHFTPFSDITPPAEGGIEMPIVSPRLWSPEQPNLYDLDIRITCGGEVLDEVHTYFGMRKISIENGRVYLNNRPYYLRMVLDQGIWPDGIYTPASVDQFKIDVEMAKAFGFNGARKHQKIEDPYYYYYCDKLGLLVWSEMPACYHFDETAIRHIVDEWQRAVRRDYNHPCIMAWVPVNESWGVEPLRFDPLRFDRSVLGGGVEVEEHKDEGEGESENIGIEEYRRAMHHLEAMYHITRALDGTRLVVSNDGWQHATTDIVTIHEYTQDHEDLARRYKAFKVDRNAACFSHGLPTILPGYSYRGQPIMITEFGGVKVEEQGAPGWGYGRAARDYQEMARRIRMLVDTILAEDDICGYCYTQLTDTEQEVNGLMTSNRVPKLPPDQLSGIFQGRPPCRISGTTRE